MIGGHAAIYYGVNRSTGDIDNLVEPTRQNGQRLLDALKAMGLEVPDMDLAEFESELIVSFGLEPDAVDILNFTHGLTLVPHFKTLGMYRLQKLKFLLWIFAI